MTAMTYDPRQVADDNIRIMPTSDDLKKPHSDQEFIEKALAEERSNQKN